MPAARQKLPAATHDGDAGERRARRRCAAARSSPHPREPSPQGSSARSSAASPVEIDEAQHADASSMPTMVISRAVEGARLHDQRAEPLDRADHLGADDHHEADAERHSRAGEDARQRRRQHDAREGPHARVSIGAARRGSAPDRHIFTAGDDVGQHHPEAAVADQDDLGQSRRCRTRRSRAAAG